LDATPTVANGENLAVQGRTVKNMSFENSIFKVTMLVGRDIPHACIMGSDFFEQAFC